jgi:hypothetical protein
MRRRQYIGHQLPNIYHAAFTKKKGVRDSDLTRRRREAIVDWALDVEN